MLFEDTYQEIELAVTGIYKEKGSRFIAIAKPVFTEDEIKTELENLRKEYFDARHHCYAWILNPDQSAQRTNDDGEPAGTAGKPILNQLLSHQLTNILVVVVRYFGGTKLGVSGLINAYKSATKDALSQALIKEKYLKDYYQFHFDYPLMKPVMRLLEDHDLQMEDPQFELDCRLKVGIRKSKIESVLAKANALFGLQIQYLYTA
jgi:uncharacterized YigZ family protein